MASFGIGELPDGGGSEVYNARRGPGRQITVVARYLSAECKDDGGLLVEYDLTGKKVLFSHTKLRFKM